MMGKAIMMHSTIERKAAFCTGETGLILVVGTRLQEACQTTLGVAIIPSFC